MEMAHDDSIEEALERIRRLRRPLAPEFKFDRLEANEEDLSAISVPPDGKKA